MGEVIEEVNQKLPETFSDFNVLLTTVTTEALCHFTAAVQAIGFFSKLLVRHGRTTFKCKAAVNVMTMVWISIQFCRDFGAFLLLSVKSYLCNSFPEGQNIYCQLSVTQTMFLPACRFMGFSLSRFFPSFKVYTALYFLCEWEDYSFILFSSLLSAPPPIPLLVNRYFPPRKKIRWK